MTEKRKMPYGFKTLSGYELRLRRPSKYPFETLEIGEFFDSEKPVATICAAVFTFKKYDLKLRQFTVRKMQDGTTRCWRTA